MLLRVIVRRLCAAPFDFAQESLGEDLLDRVEVGL